MNKTNMALLGFISSAADYLKDKLTEESEEIKEITDIDFDEFDAPYRGPKLCDPSVCRVCTEGCPTSAISKYEEGAETIDAAGTKQTVCRLNANACTVACMGMGKQFNPRAGYISPSNDPSDEELAEGIKKLESAPGLMMLDHLPQFYCDRCLLYCPAGNWAGKYRDRGLTKKQEEKR